MSNEDKITPLPTSIEITGVNVVGESVQHILNEYKKLSEKFNPSQARFAPGEFVVTQDNKHPMKVDHSFLIAGEVFVVVKEVEPFPRVSCYYEKELESLP